MTHRSCVRFYDTGNVISRTICSSAKKQTILKSFKCLIDVSLDVSYPTSINKIFDRHSWNEILNLISY